MPWLGLSALHESSTNCLYDVFGRENLEVVAHAALFDTRDIEHVGNERVEFFCRDIDALCIFDPIGIRERRFSKIFGIATNNSERRAEFVRCHREKVVFQSVDLLESLVERGVVDDARVPKEKHEQQHQHHYQYRNTLEQALAYLPVSFRKRLACDGDEWTLGSVVDESSSFVNALRCSGLLDGDGVNAVLKR